MSAHEATVDAKGGVWGGGTQPYQVDSKKFGMWLFIASDAITFAALLFAYSYVRITNEWPTPFNSSSIVLSTIMTFCLLSSSLTMVMGVMAAERGDRAKASNWIFATVLGGVAFVILHGYEWMHLIHDGITPSSFTHDGREGSPLFGATFFCCTGLHMLHVVIGVVYLSFVGLTYRFGKFKPIDVEVAGLYWHFVDLVWMFVFPLMYLLSTKI